MKNLILVSNHGNHTGFNRTWTIAGNGTYLECKSCLSRLAEKIAEKVGLDESEIYDDSLDGFEYDLVYYYIVTAEEYENGIFDGGHYGYASQEIRDYFES